MPLWVPNGGRSFSEDNVGAASAEFGTTVTANATPHAEGTSIAQLVASTGFLSYGITVMTCGTAAATASTRMLVDILIGAGGSEIELIPNLLAGNKDLTSGATSDVAMYHFPIMIPAASRISARAQALIVSDTCTVAIWLHEQPRNVNGWYGTRVTAYGVDGAASTGTSHSPGNGSYAAATQLTASTTNRIQYMQIGIDGLTDTTLSNSRGLVRIGVGATPTYLVEDLPWHESTTVESITNSWANFILSQMRFSIPAAQSLHVSAQRNVAAEARGFVVYGVD